MRDIPTLNKTLLQTEFELARALYEQLRDQGYAPFKAAAIIYRHGYLDGKDTQKAKTNEAYRKLYEKRPELAPPDAPVQPVVDQQPDTTTEGDEVSCQ